MYFTTLYYLSLDKSVRKTDRKDTWIWATYSTVLLLLLTIDISTNAFFGELVWIEHRDVPGGPAAYLNDNISAWYNTFGTTSSVALNFLGDALLVSITASCSNHRLTCHSTSDLAVLRALGLSLVDHRLPHHNLPRSIL